MGEHVVGAVDAIPEGGRIIVDIDGRSVGVFKVHGEIFALRNRCAHQGGPVCTGAIMPALRARIEASGKVKEFFDEDSPALACPWHGWEYDLRTGECLADRSRRVMTYETDVRDGQVIVRTGRRAGGDGGERVPQATEEVAT